MEERDLLLNPQRLRIVLQRTKKKDNLRKSPKKKNPYCSFKIAKGKTNQPY